LTFLIVCRAIQCELDLNEVPDDIKSLRDKIHQLKLERRLFEESVEKDRTDKESAFENERLEHQQLVQQITGQKTNINRPSHGGKSRYPRFKG